MNEDFSDEFDEDELIERHGFQAKHERTRITGNERMRNYRRRHKVRKFGAEFRDDEGLDEIIQRLRDDKVTNKDFILKSFERYKQEGGFHS